jgi:hypothetical protein
MRRAILSSSSILAAAITAAGCGGDGTTPALDADVTRDAADARRDIRFLEDAEPDAPRRDGGPDGSDGAMHDAEVTPDAEGDGGDPDGGDSGPTCSDPNEPNNIAGSATNLGNIDDCDSSGGSFMGSVTGADADWFRIHGADVSFCSVDPTLTLSGAVSLCMFLSCDETVTSFSCPAGTTPLIEAGLDGCCASGSFAVDDLNCSASLADNADFYVKVSPTSAAVCTAYQVQYHY